MDQGARQRKAAHKQRKAKGRAIAARQDEVFRQSLKRWKRERPMPVMSLAPIAAMALLAGHK